MAVIQIHVAGIRMKSHDFAFRVDRLDSVCWTLPFRSGTSTVVKTPLIKQQSRVIAMACGRLRC